MQWLKNLLGITHPEERELLEMRKETETLTEECTRLRAERETLKQDIANRKKQVIELDEEALLQDFGLYKPKYNFLSLDSYKVRLKNIRREEQYILKKREGIEGETNWTVNGNKRKGKKMISDVSKLLIRAFNLECDSLVDKVRFNNLEAYELRMRKTFDVINRCGNVLGISITNEYLDLKLDELLLSHEYALRKQEAKEELAEKRARAREEREALRELEAAKKKIEKEETHFQQAIDDKKKQLYAATDRAIQMALINKIKELEAKLIGLAKDKEDIENRTANTRAGYVYIISNIGSFGENVYKIGVTRRLDPNERVYELGDASVPFRFDVHAFIFSEDAPALENALHKEFDEFRLNKINRRREFFRVPLHRIEEVIKKYHNKEVEFQELAYADEYRQSLKMNRSVTST